MTNSSSRGTGRPLLLTPQMITRLAKAVQDGKTRAEAAAAAGVSLWTLQGWITVGRRARAAGVVPGRQQTTEQLALRLVHALEVAERKRRCITKILTPAELRPTQHRTGKPIGRPAMLTETVLDSVTTLVAAGKINEAGETAGVDRRSVHRWLTRGAEVHAAGRARTEYERLCGLLYARTQAPAAAKATEPADASKAPEKLPPPGDPVPAEPVIVISREPRRRFISSLISSRFGLRRAHRV
ncbi:hypothetical protein [Streptomyces chrestomyceticus]|uniref:hypothetical protein n=1 Tax=Streptomyces chrestomyceticus TaxID=68185 RepID=UPI0033C409ED